jgi:hypothetical protein
MEEVASNIRPGGNITVIYISTDNKIMEEKNTAAAAKIKAKPWVETRGKPS